MKTVLLASPFLSTHADAGWFWAMACGRYGYAVVPWDYRRNADFPTRNVDAMIALKTPLQIPPLGITDRVCYWPDALGRDAQSETFLKDYDRIFTCLRPTPKGMAWLPTGWDPTVHYPRRVEKSIDSIFIGTATQRKNEFLSVMEPSAVFGNGWGRNEPLYMDDYCSAMSAAKVIINIHRDEIGLNRRFFESMAVGFTITDIVPGVEEVLGKVLTNLVGFRTPAEGQALLTEFSTHERWREEAWALEQKAIEPYTYDAAVRRVLG